MAETIFGSVPFSKACSTARREEVMTRWGCSWASQMQAKRCAASVCELVSSVLRCVGESSVRVVLCSVQDGVQHGRQLYGAVQLEENEKGSQWCGLEKSAIDATTHHVAHYTAQIVQMHHRRQLV